MQGIFYIVIGLFIYFIPSLVGWKTKYASGILVLNLFLGWTVLGWIGALIWAVSAPKIVNVKPRGSFLDIINEGIKTIKNVFFMGNAVVQYDDEVKELIDKMNEGEALVKNKVNNKFEIVTAEQWEVIVSDKKEAEYEIIEEK